MTTYVAQVQFFVEGVDENHAFIVANDASEEAMMERGGDVIAYRMGALREATDEELAMLEEMDDELLDAWEESME